MIKSSAEFAIRRILVALDASPHSLAALEAAVGVASKMNAELVGLFVEDTTLLRLSELPCAREILYFSSAKLPLNRATMESRLKAHSEVARKAVESVAKDANVAWSFRIARGKVVSELLAAASGADLVALGKGGWGLNRRVRIGSTALELAASSLPVLLLPEHGLSEKPHLLVYYDHSQASQRALLAAASLAGFGMDGITVLVASRNKHQAMQAEKEIVALIEGRNIDVRYVVFEPDNQESLWDALKAEKDCVLVLGDRKLLDKLPPLDILLHQTEVALLFLGNAPG